MPVINPKPGGGTPGGSNTQVQFNDSGSFNGDAGLTFNKTTDLLTTQGSISLDGGGAFEAFTISPTNTTDNDYGSSISISGGVPSFDDSNQGGAVNVTGGAGMTGGTTQSVGGAVNITGGQSRQGNTAGGGVTVTGGAANGTGTGGLVTIDGGPSTGGTGGGVLIRGSGSQTHLFDSGSVTISGGSSSVGESEGGSVNITGGNGSTADTGGNISMTSGTGGSTAGGGAMSFQSGNGGSSSGNGGLIQFVAGNGVAGNSSGGDITLITGNKSGNGTVGKISLKTGGVNNSAILNPAGIGTSDKTFEFPNISAVFGLYSTTTIHNATFEASTYTPTLTGVANVTGSTAYLSQWMRVGKTVTVSGVLDIDPTLTATSTQLGISLPVASALTSRIQVAGTSACPNIAGLSASILGDAANDRAQMEYISSDPNSQPMYFNFTYQIL